MTVRAVYVTKTLQSKCPAKIHNSSQPSSPVHFGAFQPRGAWSVDENKRLWLNALWLLAVNSPPSPLGWPLLWTYELCRSAWRWETVQGLLIKYYSPLNGWRLASVGMLELNLPPGQMCVWVRLECLCVSVCRCERESREGRGCCTYTVNGVHVWGGQWRMYCGFMGRMCCSSSDVWAASHQSCYKTTHITCQLFFEALHLNRGKRILKCFGVMLRKDTSYFWNCNELVSPVHNKIMYSLLLLNNMGTAAHYIYEYLVSLHSELRKSGGRSTQVFKVDQCINTTVQKY